MSIVSLIFALLLEQYRPISRTNPVYLTFIRFANYLEHVFHGGKARHGMIAWLVAVLPVTLLCTIIYYILANITFLFGWLWCVFILYVNMGFRQFSHAFTEVSDMLRDDDLVNARSILGKWIGQDVGQMPPSEIASAAIEHGTLNSLRYVFAPIFWFVVLAPVLGPAGIIIYRINTLLCQKWGTRPDLTVFGHFVMKVQYYLDWLPARLMAISFAIMGDFEDAIHCWRTQASNWPDRIQGVLLATLGGALGVCLSSVINQDYTDKVRSVIGLGEEASPDALQRAVGLIWRTVLLWMALIALFSFVSP